MAEQKNNKDGKKVESTRPNEEKLPSGGQNVGSGGFTRSLAGDKSLAAFKNWITGMASNLNPNVQETMTEEQWVESWQQFWSKEPSETRLPQALSAANASEPQPATAKSIEDIYPGVTQQIQQYEEAEWPACPHCGSSARTAKVSYAITGRTITLSASSARIKLFSPPPAPGNHYCKACEKFFDYFDGSLSGVRMHAEDRKAKLLEMEKAQLMATLGMTPEELPAAIASVKKMLLEQEKSAGKKEKNKRKSTSTGSTSSNMKITLSACSPQVRKIFETLVNGWREVGGTVQCRRSSSIYLRLITKAHASGKNAQLPHNFNLVVLRAPRGRYGPHIQVKWDSGKTINPSPYLDFAYLDCIPEVITQFEKMASSLPGFQQQGTIMIDERFNSIHTQLLLNGMKGVKAAEAKAE